ncbi:Mobile element protein [Candidatus Enterovibrio altilux]|uniref:Mobile element protein n=1 Tax=Candidatus Enterovibrio altilux TaxID=1927128 RepID=A0A291B8K8_9GAMM|nr:Mobile element protein [Candidatus Enterovibrio luxaltus]
MFKLMNKFRYKITNSKQYNQALINCGSLTFWIDEKTIQLWNQIKQGNHGRSRLFNDLTIVTALMVIFIFSKLLKGR